MSKQPSAPDLRAVTSVEPRILNGRFWHQGPTRRPLLFTRSPTGYEGRYHRRRSAGAWYASSRERAAWAELFRHHASPELSPFEVRRRIGRVWVESLRVLDLTDPNVQQQLGVTTHQLVEDDFSVCQLLGDAAREGGFEGILAPSAALPGESTLVIFRRGMKRVSEEHSRIQRPPRSLLPLLRRVRRRRR